jgi:hypothetical protein
VKAGPAAAVASTRTRQVITLAVTAVVTAALAAGPGGGDSARAATMPSARAQADTTAFGGVSCTGGSFCIAVGTYSKPGHSGRPLLEEWNGRKWQVFAAPPGLDHITCAGPAFCLAATSPDGEMIWNGRVWRVFKDQPPNSGDVTCASATFCVSYANYYGTDNPPDVADWTGNSAGWQPMPGAGNDCGGLDCTVNGLSCVSATNCGDGGTTCDDYECDSMVGWSQTWNGTAWVQSSPAPINGGSHSACAGRAFCLAVGASPAAMITRNWGSTWQDASAGRAAACQGVALCSQPAILTCGSPWFCMEFPTAYAKADPIWNGSRWRAVRVARIDGHLPGITAVSCGSPRNCAAIGTYQLNPRSNTRPIAEHWNGTAWQVTPMPTP